MNNNLLKEAFTLAAGKSSERLVDFLNDKNYINELFIAKKLDITVNQTRNLLYKISEYGLVSSIRKKDKRKGWYTYFWKLENLKSLEFLKKVILNEINQLSHQIKSRESKVFYVCKSCNIEFNEEKSLINNFICNECGSLLSLKDTSSDIKEYNKGLIKFQNELSLVENEIDLEKQKLNKQKIKLLKNEQEKKEIKKKKIIKEKTKDKKNIKNKVGQSSIRNKRKKLSKNPKIKKDKTKND